MTPLLESAIAKLKERGEALGVALTLEQSLEDDRAAIKADAIQRINFAHRVKQRSSIVERFKADAEYQAAKAEATQASLITPTMVELEAQLRWGQTAIDAATKAVDEATLVNVQLVADVEDAIRANHSLLHARNEAQTLAGDRILEIEKLQAANTDLVQANRDLAEQLTVAAEAIAHLQLSLENSVETLP